MRKWSGVLLMGVAVVLFLFPAVAEATDVDVEAAELNGGMTLPSYRAGDKLIVRGSELNETGWARLKAEPEQFGLVLDNGQTSIPAGTAVVAFPNLLSLTAETVTQVGKEAFIGSTVLESVSLPAATNIAERAFNTCPELREVSLPRVSTLGSNAFAGCAKLKAVSLPAAAEVPLRAFANCTALASLSLPAAKKIGQSAFESCSTLTEIFLPVVTEIGQRAFYSAASVTKISLPVVTDIGQQAFYGAASVTEVTMPKVTTIRGEAFSGCTALKALYLEDADPSVAEKAFDGVSRITIYSNRKTLTGKNYPLYDLANPKDPEKDSGGGCDSGMRFWGLAPLAMFYLYKRRSQSL